MSTTQKEVLVALVDALVQSNRFMEQFMRESPELCAQFEFNQDLIQMVEPDLDEIDSGVVIDEGVLRCEHIYTRNLTKTDDAPEHPNEGTIVANELIIIP